MKFLYTTIIFISSYAVHECVYSFQSLYLCCACTHWVINLLLYCTAVATRDIEALKMSCTSKKCQWVGELGSLETHLKTCEYVFIICTNICKFNDQLMFILRGKLNTHLTNDCPRRQHKCPHCQEMGEHQERTTTHLKTCPKVKISCVRVNFAQSSLPVTNTFLIYLSAATNVCTVDMLQLVVSTYLYEKISRNMKKIISYIFE